MNLDDLRKALDKGEVFTGAAELNQIQKKADGIGDLTGEEKDKVFEERNIRVEKSWNEATDEDRKEMMDDDAKRIKKMEASQKNEIEHAKISFLESEIKIYEEYVSNLEEKLKSKKQLISDLNSQIKVIKDSIK